MLDEPDAVKDLGWIIGHVRACLDWLREQSLMQVVEYGRFGYAGGLNQLFHAKARFGRLLLVLGSERQFSTPCLEFQECFIN